MKKNNKYPMFKQLKNLLVVVLSVSMMISMLYQPTYALDTNVSYNNQTVHNTTAEDYEKDYVNIFDNQYDSYNEEDIDYEDESLREEYVKHFVMNDGTTQAVVYETQVHELDDSGVYQEIDNTLSDNNNIEFENTKNDKWKVKFSKEAKKTLVHIHEDNMNIKWGIANFNESKASFLVDDEPYTKLSNKAVSAVVVYENILDNIDVQYQLSHQKVKENVILKSKEAQHIIYYDLDTNGYDISVVDNQIVLSKDNKEDYVIAAPYMMDNNGVFHDGITLSYENNQVKMELDSEWLLAEDRVYPVIVDPTIKKKLTNSSVDNTSVNSARPTSNAMYQYGALYVGRESSSYNNLRGAFKFTLPTIDESNMVISSSITLSQLNYYGSGNVYVRVASINENLPLSSLTWNKLNGKTGWTLDYVNVRASTVGKWFSFDVTKIVREWYTTGKNYGLMLASSNENSTYKYATFVTTRNGGLSSRWPYASVTYISQDGLESYLTYQTMNTVSMGSFNVGDFNGNLIYTYNDFSMSGNHMPVGVSHVYNHHQRSKEDTVSSNMKYGKGMCLNVSMKIEYNSTNDYYTLTDEDGTVHYFYKDSTSGKYLKEYDTEVKITVNENNYTIDNASQRILFNKTTGLITEVQDKVSNKKQVYTYNTNNQLVTITDGANRETTFTYDEDNYLTSISYADNRVISYTYTNNQLATITQPDGNVITFTYNGDLLESVSNVNEGKVQVEYLSVSPRRVVKLTRYGKNNTEGDSLSFTYNTGDTVVTDEDGYALTYMFDLSGHTVCVKDSEGNAIYGQYENSDDDNKHSLSFESKLQTSVVNLAMNHNPILEATTAWTSSTTLKIIDVENETKPEFTGKAFQLLDVDSIHQDINYSVTQNESYTISAYVKVKSLTPIDTTHDYGVYVGIKDTELHASNLYNDLNEWKRISYTYTADTDITNNNWSIQIGTTNITGEVLVKNIQLEKGTVVNRYNFIENCNFYNGIGSTSISYWSRNASLTSNDKIAVGYVGNGYYVAGNLSKFKSLYQTIPMKGNKGDVFVLSGWGKGNPMPRYNLQNTVTGNTEERKTTIAINFLNSNGNTLETHDVYFTSMSNEWQYTSGSIKASVDYEAVQIVLRFAYQVSEFTFDNIQLYMESFGTSYEHDDKGRVIASQDVEGNIVKTEYMDITITEEDGTQTTTDVVEYVEYKRKDDETYLKKIVYEYN
ncbi:MAG: DNRLRE domain-containing protein, partial [Erysipelotrichaceae bacterium]|nr:DNRLRE domain-containing protein [Erysipelotrichaceae bacterium]